MKRAAWLAVGLGLVVVLASAARASRPPRAPENPLVAEFNATMSGVTEETDVFEMQAKGAEFAKAHGADAIGFLRQTVERSPNRAPGGRVACHALAALGSTDVSARQALLEFAGKGNYYRQHAAVVAISFLPPDAARVIAEQLVDLGERTTNFYAALALLRSVGNAATGARLSTLLKQRLRPVTEAAVKQTVLAISCRLREIKTERERQEWARQDLAFWQIQQYAPAGLGSQAGFDWMAKRLAARGEKFSKAFLTYKMSPDLLSKEAGFETAGAGDTALAATILAAQEKEAALPLLKEHLASVFVDGEVCRLILATMKSPAAVRALEETLKRPLPLRAAQHLATLLGLCGDERTVPLLKGYAMGMMYDRDTRQRFEFAADQILDRLAGRPPREMPALTAPPPPALPGPGDELPTLTLPPTGGPAPTPTAPPAATAPDAPGNPAPMKAEGAGG